jgi:CheY-like chemotaxis protein
MLERMGHRVSVMDDGHAALQLLQHQAFELALVDIQMPLMDGFEFTASLRRWEAAQGRQRLPVVALTAQAMLEDKERCLQSGMDDYLSKPITTSALVTVLERFRPES